MKLRSRNGIILKKVFLWLFLLLLVFAAGWEFYRYAPEFSLFPKPEATPPSFDARTVTVGVDSSATGMLLYSLDYFLPHRYLKAKPVVIEDSGERWMRMAAGNLDFCISTIPEFALGAARHNPGKAVAVLYSTSGDNGVLLGGTPSTLDLSLVPGSAAHYLLINYLDSKGVSTAETTIIPADNAKTAYDLFSGGKINAVSIPEPYLSKSVRSGANVAALDKEKFSIDGILIAGRFPLEYRKRDIRTVLNAWFRMAEFIKENPGLAKKLISTKSGRPVSEIDALFSAIILKNSLESKSYGKESLIENLKKAQQVWTIEGLPNADKQIDFENSADFGFLGDIAEEPSSPASDAETSPVPESPASPVETDKDGAGI